MQEENGLPIYNGPVDHLRHGFFSLESELGSNQHPVSVIENSNNAWMSKLEHVRRTYGTHLAMRLATEKATFDKQHRFNF
jgi:hypothetical protein